MIPYASVIVVQRAAQLLCAAGLSATIIPQKTFVEPMRVLLHHEGQFIGTVIITPGVEGELPLADIEVEDESQESDYMRVVGRALQLAEVPKLDVDHAAFLLDLLMPPPRYA